MDKKNVLAVLIGVSLSAFAFLISHFGLLDTIELKTLDLRFRIRGRIAIQAPIVVISIDQDSFDELQLPWPWPRTLHAELIRKLVKGGAKIIAFDILFTESKPDPKEDQALAAAIKEAGRVILGAELTEVPSDFGPKTVMNLPIPDLRDHALGYGLVGFPRNRDGVVRSADLMSYFQDRAFPSFGYLIFQSLVQQKAGPKFTLDSTLINFRGPARTFPTVPYYRVLNDEIDAKVFRD
jgi:adenylate cyclase